MLAHYSTSRSASVSDWANLYLLISRFASSDFHLLIFLALFSQLSSIGFEMIEVDGAQPSTCDCLTVPPAQNQHSLYIHVHSIQEDMRSYKKVKSKVRPKLSQTVFCLGTDSNQISDSRLRKLSKRQRSEHQNA